MKEKPNYYIITTIILIFIVIALVFMGGFRLKADQYTWFNANLCVLRKSAIEYNSLVGWDSYRAGGQPVFSNPDVTFFDISYIFYFIFNDTNIALTLALLVYVSFGILGIYLLVFKLTKDNRASTLSSLFFFLNGFFVSLYVPGKHINYLVPYCFLSWIFLLYLKMGKDIKKIITNSIFIGILLTIAFLATGMAVIVWILFFLPIFIFIDIFIFKSAFKNGKRK